MKGSPSEATVDSALRRHLLVSDLAALPLVAVTSGKVEAFLRSKAVAGLSAQSVNHLRSYVSAAFNAARRAERWHGSNPVADVKAQRVQNGIVGDYLRRDEVTSVLMDLAGRGHAWTPAG